MPARRKRKKSKKSAQSRILGRWLLRAALVLLVAGLVALLMIDIQVIRKFAGSKWELPAHVFSRPLELYQGHTLSREELEWELKALGYTRTATAKKPGQYSVSANRVELFSRGFEFWDGSEASRRIMVSFSDNAISQLSADSKTLPITRLEPMVIGGIYPAQSEDRELLKLEQVPVFLPLGLLAVEDRGFYLHHGISLRGIARAMVSNFKEGKVVQGGSTLTQQLVKNFYLTERQTLSRKALEAVMALLLELHFDKDEILEAYLNEVYLGQAGKRSINGFGLASRHYFNRPVDELELHQVALLIGMVKGASFYNPHKHPERARQRRNLVLEQMVDEGIVDRQDGLRAMKMPLDLEQGSLRIGQYPDYLELVKRQLRMDYDEDDLLTHGLKIFTNFDPQIQRKLEFQLQKRLAAIEADYRLNKNTLQGASIVMRVGTAEVVALSGDRNAGFSGFNRALDARRPIGSTIKPAVMLAALQRPSQYTLSTLIDDSPLSIDLGNGQRWKPQNYERVSHGQVPIFEVLARSYNQATARLGLEIGIDQLVKVIRDLGYQGDIPAVPSLTLGALDMSPMEVAQLYHTIAANGFLTRPRAIQAVYDAAYKPLQRYSYQAEQRFDPEEMHLLHYALQLVMREGTGKTAYNYLPRDRVVAGKTGTTNGQRDSWFAGFGGNYLGVVWLGRDDNGTMPVSGGTGALTVWTAMMADMGISNFPFVKPQGVNYYWVEPETQVLSGKGCRGARNIPYIEGSQPKRRGSCYRGEVQKALDWLKDVFGI